MLKGILAESADYKKGEEDLDCTHGPNKACHHCDEEGEDGHQHAGLAEPPEDFWQGRALSPSSFQLIVPQRFKPGTRNRGQNDDKLYEFTSQPNFIIFLVNLIYWINN